MALGRVARVVLLEPQIPQNTGAIGRTCLGLGAELHLIEPLGFSLDSSKVKRAGLDYWEKLAPSTWPSWEAFERSELACACQHTTCRGDCGWDCNSEAALCFSACAPVF